MMLWRGVSCLCGVGYNAAYSVGHRFKKLIQGAGSQLKIVSMEGGSVCVCECVCV